MYKVIVETKLINNTYRTIDYMEYNYMVAKKCIVDNCNQQYRYYTAWSVNLEFKKLSNNTDAILRSEKKIDNLI